MVITTKTSTFANGMIKVSVVLPIYNVAPYLDAAFKSILGQTLTELEVIAVNDGSTDNSQEIIEKYAAQDRRIQCVVQENRGLSGARNTGMRYIRGQYVFFMDSDDVIEQDTLQRCYDYAETHDADICIFDAEPMYETGAAPIAWDYNRAFLLERDKAYEGEQLMDLQMRHNRQRAVVWLQFIKWSYLQETGLSFYEGIIHEDELFTPQLFLQSRRIYYLPCRFVKHRIRRSSIVGKGYSKRNFDCYLTVFDELFQFQDSPIIRRFARYTLSAAFYTGHVIPLTDKVKVFWRTLRSGYLPYIHWKSLLVFWFRS